MADGQVVYEVRADASKVDKDLQTTEKKIAAGLDEGSKKGGAALDKNLGDAYGNAQKKTINFSDASSKALSSIGRALDFAGISNSSGIINKSISSIGQTAVSSGLIAAGGFAAIGTAAVSLCKTAVTTAADLDAAMNQFAAATGIGKDELQGYEDVLKSIYANNYGESFDDIATKMAAVKQQFDGINDADLQKVTEGVYALESTFDMDFNETLRGTDQLMTQFGLTAEQALDLLAAGGQAGLDYTHELGDNIAEYAGKFAQAGYSADEYFQLLKNGSKGGAYNLDKVNDAINEITTRLADGTIGDNLKDFSAETQKTFNAWKTGGATQKQVIDAIVKDIQNCTNQQEAMTLAATAFGTMGEDANIDFVKSLSSVGDSFDKVTGKMESVKKIKYDDLGSMLEGVQRQIELLLIPLGEMLIPLLQQLMQDIITPLMPLLEALMEPLGELIINILQPITTLLGALIEPLMNILSAILPPLIEVITQLLAPAMEVINSVLTPLIDLLQSMLIPVLNFLMPIIQAVADAFTGVMGGSIRAMLPFLETLIGAFQGIIDFITGVFTGNWEKAWNGIVGAFKAIINLIPAFFEGVVNAIIGIINGITGGISATWTWAGLPPIPQIPNVTIPRFKAGIDFVPTDFFPAYLDAGERVLTKEENARFNALGGLGGIEKGLSQNMPAGTEHGAPTNVYVESPVNLDGKTISKNTTKHQYVSAAVKRYK